METKIFTSNISGAAELLKAGGLVAVPTETVYGLAANGLDDTAVSKIYEVKGRPDNKPLSLMVADASAMDELCLEVPSAARFLADCFWPGPLTIVLKAKETIAESVRAGGKTVGLRCPDHPLTLELLRTAKIPLAAPSANPSGEPSPKTAQQVASYFDGKIEGIIDGGACGLGTESTLIDMSKTPYTILRQGALSLADLSMALMAHLTIIGITGGTGCGKTTALSEIIDLGGLVIDCDEVYHRLLNESDELLVAINQRFPGVVPAGTRDTKALGEIVFSNPHELMALNQITHKFVGEEIMKELTDFAKNGGRLAAIDAIALMEGPIAGYCKATVGIIATEALRVSRLMTRDGISEDYAKLRIAAQKSNEYFQETCDHTVSNDGGEEDFRLKCKTLFEKIIGGNK